MHIPTPDKWIILVSYLVGIHMRSYNRCVRAEEGMNPTCHLINQSSNQSIVGIYRVTTVPNLISVFSLISISIPRRNCDSTRCNLSRSLHPYYHPNDTNRSRQLSIRTREHHLKEAENPTNLCTISFKPRPLARMDGGARGNCSNCCYLVSYTIHNTPLKMW